MTSRLALALARGRQQLLNLNRHFLKRDQIGVVRENRPFFGTLVFLIGDVITFVGSKGLCPSPRYLWRCSRSEHDCPVSNDQCDDITATQGKSTSCLIFQRLTLPSISPIAIQSPAELAATVPTRRVCPYRSHSCIPLEIFQIRAELSSNPQRTHQPTAEIAIERMWCYSKGMRRARKRRHQKRTGYPPN